MIKELKQVVLTMQKLNNKVGKSVFSEEEISDELENIIDAEKISDEIMQLLHDLLKTDLSDRNRVDEKLVFLHLKLLDCIWHIEQVHEMVKKFISLYDE